MHHIHFFFFSIWLYTIHNPNNGGPTNDQSFSYSDFNPKNWKISVIWDTDESENQIMNAYYLSSKQIIHTNNFDYLVWLLITK